MTKKLKLPKTLGECADLYYTTRNQRLALQKEVDALEEYEKAIKAHIIDTLPKSQASGVAGRLARVRVELKTRPQVSNWDATWKYIVKKKAYDLMQKRLSDSAVEARWEAGEEIPGVDHFQYKTVGVNKL